MQVRRLTTIGAICVAGIVVAACSGVASQSTPTSAPAQNSVTSPTYQAGFIAGNAYIQNADMMGFDHSGTPTENATRQCNYFATSV